MTFTNDAIQNAHSLCIDSLEMWPVREKKISFDKKAFHPHQDNDDDDDDDEQKAKKITERSLIYKQLQWV